MKKIIPILLLAFFFTTYIFGQGGNALNFDGTDDYVLTASTSSLALTATGTIEGWFKTGSSPQQEIISLIGLASNEGMELIISGGNCEFNAFIGGWQALSSSGTNFADNSWHHVAGVYNGSNLKLYVDGLEKANSSVSGSLNTGDARVNIGRHSSGVNYFNGDIDEVRFWSVGRSQTEIQNAMNNVVDPTTSGLIAYFRFDQGNAGGNNAGVTTLTDLTSNHNDGTINNFALTGSSSNWVTSDAPLPVELINFSASANQNNVNLKWQTATEVNNSGFEVQRKIPDQSAEGGRNDSWEKVGFVPGAGNSNSPKSYSFTDQPIGGTTFSYRIKQIDNDGKFKYYDAITITLSSKEIAELMDNYPNPFNPSTAIKFYIPKNSDVSIKIYDMLGKEVTTLINKETDAGYHIVYWNGQDRLGNSAASGVYLYRLTAGSFIETKKMALLK